MQNVLSTDANQRQQTHSICIVLALLSCQISSFLLYPSQPLRNLVIVVSVGSSLPRLLSCSYLSRTRTHLELILAISLSLALILLDLFSQLQNQQIFFNSLTKHEIILLLDISSIILKIMCLLVYSSSPSIKSLQILKH